MFLPKEFVLIAMSALSILIHSLPPKAIEKLSSNFDELPKIFSKCATFFNAMFITHIFLTYFVKIYKTTLQCICHWNIKINPIRFIQ